MSRSTVFGDNARIASGVCARANNEIDEAAVVASLVRKVRMQEIKVRNGSRCCTAMKLTIGAFHDGASRLSTRSAPLTPRASSARRVATLGDAPIFLTGNIAIYRSGRALRLDPPYSLGSEILARHLEIVMRLQVQPKLRAVTKIQTQPQRR